MKIKCIRSYGDYLTEGKVYHVTTLAEDRETCEFLSDHGTPVFVHLRNSAHGVFELIDDGETPAPVEPPKQAEEQPKKSQPKFGDILHIKGHPYVFIRIDSDGDWVVCDEKEEVEYCDAETFDEYAPDPHQEQRERILKRWQRKTLDNAHDTEVCVAEMRVSDLIDFVQESILAET